jgi:hypothetical protein
MGPRSSSAESQRIEVSTNVLLDRACGRSALSSKAPFSRFSLFSALCATKPLVLVQPPVESPCWKGPTPAFPPQWILSISTQ